MKRRYREEQIIGILKEREAGMPLVELIRKYGICEQTYYRWKSRYGGMDSSEARRLRQLEEENRRLRQLVAGLALDRAMLQDVCCGEKAKACPPVGCGGLCAGCVGGERAAGVDSAQGMGIIMTYHSPAVVSG